MKSTQEPRGDKTLRDKPYDRARLDVVTGSIVADGALLDLSGRDDVAQYLDGIQRREGTLDALPDETFGAAVAYDVLLEAKASELKTVIESLQAKLAPGAPLLFTVYQDACDRADVSRLLEETGQFDKVRVEARRPYLFEPPRTRIFAMARRR